MLRFLILAHLAKYGVLYQLPDVSTHWLIRHFHVEIGYLSMRQPMRVLRTLQKAMRSPKPIQAAIERHIFQEGQIVVSPAFVCCSADLPTSMLVYQLGLIFSNYSSFVFWCVKWFNAIKKIGRAVFPGHTPGERNKPIIQTSLVEVN